MACCPTSKHRFPTEEAANTEMKRLRVGRTTEIRSAPTRSQRRKRNTKPVWERAYLCPWCDDWHLTSKEEQHG